jgi:hypothetical protein
MLNTPIVVLRSFCVGVAALVAALFVSPLLLNIYVIIQSPPSPPGGGQVGWDVLTIFHNVGPLALLVPLTIFGIGFLVGFRYFSKQVASK